MAPPSETSSAGRARRRRRGLLDDAGEAIEPFVYWGFLGLCGVVPLVVATVVLVLAVVGAEPGLVLLALIPTGVGLACCRSWRSWHRDRRRHRRRPSSGRS